jgi:hypothetical protein
MPDGVGLGVAMQQQKWWATASHQGIDVDIAQVDDLLVEMGEKRGCVHKWFEQVR